jgi:hypothetical protein
MVIIPQGSTHPSKEEQENEKKTWHTIGVKNDTATKKKKGTSKGKGERTVKMLCPSSATSWRRD